MSAARPGPFGYRRPWATHSSSHILVPLNPLSAFQGEPRNGNWTLAVSTADGDGLLGYFGLSIR